MERMRQSFWAWGVAEKFPDDAARAQLAALAAFSLGLDRAPDARPLPKLEDIVVAPPRIAVPAPLAAFTTDAREPRIRHTYGRSFRDLVRAFAGDFTPAPDLVAAPRDEADVIAVLEWAERTHVAVVPFGGGTSVVGGVECAERDRFAGVVCMDLTALDRVLEVDRRSLAARIQAGATGPKIEAQLAPHGLTLRHFPQSFEFSTLGGWIATRAGGHFATLYTHIDDKVEAVRMVTPRGLFATARLPASGAGPQPERLVLGSEGALGVITEAWVRVHERPRWRASASAHFDAFERAVDAARRIAQSGLHPANCRLLDRDEAMLNRVVDDGHHVLLLGFESADHDPSASLARAIDIARDAGATCVEAPRLRVDSDGVRDANAERWRASFLDAPYLQSALVSLGMIADTFETACTWSKFETLDAAVRNAVTDAMRRTCGAGRITCRFTHVYPDGPAPYYTFLAPAGGQDPLAAWAEIKRAASDALAAHGGTITHHHAVGRTHRPWYEREVPEPFLRVFRAAKAELDPGGVLNPGVLVAPR